MLSLPNVPAPVRRALERGSGPTHILVRHRGETLIDQRAGVGPDALFWPYSTSKLWVATCIWALADDGVCDIDRPVADYWPEFAAAGKAQVTVREVLQHRSGLPRIGNTISEVFAMHDWDRSCARIALARPQPNRLDTPAYEWLAWGFILGQVISGATGQAFEKVLHERILQPLGATSTARLHPEERWRLVPFRGTDPSTALVAAVLNRDAVRYACIPAGGIWSNADDLAALCAALAHTPGRLGMRADTLARMCEPSNDGEFDRYSGSRVWWGQGVQLGHSAPTMMGASAFGRRSTGRTFGHNGSNTSMVWHDLDRDLTFVHLSARIRPFPRNRQYLMALADAVMKWADSR